MKKFALLLSLMLCLQAFAAIDTKDGNTQSYIIHDTGEISTIKNYYNPTSLHMFLVPDVFLHIKVNLKKAMGNYFVDEWESIYTVNKDGFVTKVDEVLFRAEDVAVYGHSYYIQDNNVLNIVRNDGIIVKYKDPIGEDNDITKVKVVGGSFFITEENKLVIVDPSGYFIDKSSHFRYKHEDVVKHGHNWYQTRDGKLFTIGFKPVMEQGRDGVEVPKLDGHGNKRYYIALYVQKETMTIIRKGGNYFFDNQRNLHTVSSEGVLNMGEKNRKLKVIDMEKNQYRNLPPNGGYGLNYFIYEDGSVMQIDNAGQMWSLGKAQRRTARSNMYPTLM